MIRDVIKYIDSSLCAEIAMVLFFFAFLAIFVRSFLSSKEEIEHVANLPMHDGKGI